MGVCYYIVDPGRKVGLDVHKAHALARACGNTTYPHAVAPLTLDAVRSSAAGWFMSEKIAAARPRLAGPQDVKWSAWLSSRVETWLGHVGPGDFEIVAEWAPWEEEPDGWDLWTLYIHPVTGEPDDGFRLWPIPETNPGEEQ